MKPATVAALGSISRPQYQQDKRGACAAGDRHQRAAEIVDALGDRDRRRLDDQHVQDREAEEPECPDQQPLRIGERRCRAAIDPGRHVGQGRGHGGPDGYQHGPVEGVGQPDAAEGDSSCGQQRADFAMDAEADGSTAEQQMGGGKAEDPSVQGKRRIAAEDDAAGADHEHAAAEKQQPGRHRELLFAPASQLVAEGRSGIQDPESGQNRKNEQGGLSESAHPLIGDDDPAVPTPEEQLGCRDGERTQRQPVPALPEQDSDAGREREGDKSDVAAVGAGTDQHRGGERPQHADAADQHRGPAHGDEDSDDSDQGRGLEPEDR